MRSKSNMEADQCLQQEINNGNDQEQDTEKRELTQTDHLNKKLLESFLDLLKQADSREEPDPLNENGHKLIIGISGVTNGGKTSLAQRLQAVLPEACYICQDDFFLPEDSEQLEFIPELNYSNWDVIGAIDMDSMIKQIQLWKQKQTISTNCPVLLIDGFLLYSHPDMAKCFNLKYFLTLPYDVCRQRRELRSYQPPEVKGYFDMICWPQYLKHVDDLKNHTDITYLDGCKTQEEIFNQVLVDIKELINQQSPWL